MENKYLKIDNLKESDISPHFNIFKSMNNICILMENGKKRQFHHKNVTIQ